MRDADAFVEVSIEYEDFLRGKVERHEPSGFDFPLIDLNPRLFEFQRTIVRWGLRTGRGAFFEDCGLGKTFQQLEWAHRVSEHTGKPVIIFAPLAVAEQTEGEGQHFGITVTPSPVWMDIDQSDTLTREGARDEEDERHICPLQLQVIERGIELWTNPGELVLSPFMGIGSEGHVALKMGRRFHGIELKRSYWEQAAKNLEFAEKMANAQINLLSGAV